MIKIIPAIDIIEGKCVRLTKGDYAQKKVYDSSPVEMSKRFADCGVERIHLVDLDGAKVSSPRNLDILEQIAKTALCEVEWGGGISGGEELKSVFNAGANYAIIGSVAAQYPDLFEDWLSEYGSRMILGADVRDGRIAVKGWTEETALSLESFISSFLPKGLKEVICTDICKDGLLLGPSFELYSSLQGSFKDISITVSGGISSMRDIEKLDTLNLKKVIIGKAIYEGKITLKEIEQWSLNA